jgi:hypothetical protein
VSAEELPLGGSVTDTAHEPALTATLAAQLTEPEPEPEPPPHLLEPDEIRARRRPRALFFVWVWELVCALLVATPVHAWAKAVFGARPDGDAAIFTPGGHALLSWLGEDGPSLAIVLRTTFLLLLVFGILGQLVTGTLIASLATGVGDRGRASSFGETLRIGTRSFFPLLLIGLVSGALEAFFVGIGTLASSSVDHSLTGKLGDARAFTARLVVFGLFVLAASVVGVVADLVRVAAVRHLALASTPERLRTVLREAFVRGTSAARRSFVRSMFGWGWRAALSLALVVVGALAGDAVGAQAGGALWLLFAGHQALLFARVALRASWLAYALRLTRPATERATSVSS